MSVAEPPRSPDASNKPRLLDRVRASLRAKHYSRSTETAYIAWIRRFIFFNNTRHPDALGLAEVNAFLSHLASERHVSASTENQPSSALLFLYEHVLGRRLVGVEAVTRAKRPLRLPVVLTREEVAEVLRHLTGVCGLMAALMYGSGLRLLECCSLRVKDIDFDRREILVRDGKGRRDRRTKLPASIAVRLQRHLVVVRAQHEADLRAGAGSVALPDALAVKYPRAAWEWSWQWVFPATVLRGGGDRSAAASSSARVGAAAGLQGGGA